MKDHEHAAKLLQDHFTASAAPIANAFVAFALLGAIGACSRSPEIADMNRERDIVADQLCSKKTLQEATSVLGALEFEYQIDASRTRLMSIRRFAAASPLVDDAIVIDVEFDSSERMIKCEVRALVVH